MTYNPRAHLEIRFYNSAKTLATSSVIKQPIYEPNTWQQVTMTMTTSGATGVYAYASFGADLIPSGKVWNTSDDFWVGDMSYTGPSGQLLGPNQINSVSSPSTYPCWGVNTNMSYTFQSATHLSPVAGADTFMFHATTANTTGPASYPTTTSAGVDYMPVTASTGPFTFSYYIYWNGASWERERGCLL